MSSQLRNRLLFCTILALAIGLRWLAFSPFAIVHLDEVLQYQERAFRMVFGRGLVPWETRYGLRNALIPDLLAGPMWLVSRFSDNFWAPIFAARTVFAALCLISVPAAYAIGSARSRAHGLVAMFVAAVWFESVLFGVQVLSESIATACGCAGAAEIMRARDNRGAACLAGFLLTMMVLLRLQYAAFAVVIVLMTLGRDMPAWRRLMFGGALALVLGALVDLGAGGTPFAWVATNFGVNLGQGRAATFGVSPPWAYIVGIVERWSPLGAVILVGAAFSGARYRPLLFAALANIAVHSLIGHKEYRFIWLSVFVLVILAAIASVDLVLRLLARRPALPSQSRVRTAALGGLCLAWAALSLLTFSHTGGLAAFRDEGPLTRLVLEATQIPGSCAIGVPTKERKAAAFVFMPRPLEPYLVPDAMNDGAIPFDPNITRAVDALVVTDRGRPPAEYRQISCRMDGDHAACLFWRPGGCHRSPAADANGYQRMLTANDQ
jgi:phosphatidylinositol glycan class B